MAEILTQQQQMAVNDRGGNLLISAAAGSGKTKVLVDRLMRYLMDETDPANLDEFLIITYTKAAATELRAKIAAKLTDAIAQEPKNRHLQQQMQRLYLTKISTVHAFCGDLLREYAYRLDISSDFRVADESECLELQLRVIEKILDDAYSAESIDTDFYAFVDTQGLGRDDRQIPELILKVYNSARCHLHPQEWLDGCVSAQTVSDIADAADTVWGAYLVSELHAFLDLQVQAIERCIESAMMADGFEKPVALLQSTISQLEHLRSCTRWNAVRDGLNLSYGRLVFPKKCSDPILAEQIKAVRAACKKGIERFSRKFANSSERILMDVSSSSAAICGLVNLVKDFADAYAKLKHSRHILDFGDLEHKTLDLLVGKRREGPTAIALEISKRFREIMVDEYQDSNSVQDAIFSSLTTNRSNCFMVGDVKQSIYQFRLADPDIFLQKYQRFVPAEEAMAGQNRKILLSSNFRSGGAVISAVNDVFSFCMSPRVGGLHYGKDEALREGIPHCQLDEPEIELHGINVHADTYAEEAAFASERVRQLLDGHHMVREGDTVRPIRPEDIVILLRSPGSVGRDFQIALESSGIPCTMGGSVDLLQTEEVGTLHALLQIICNPLQDIPLLTVLTSRLYCFTADELAQFRSGNQRGSIYGALCASQMPKAKMFVRTLMALRSGARMKRLTEIIGMIFTVTRLDSVYASLPDGDDCMENLQSFCQLADAYASSGRGELSDFLEQLASQAERGIIAPGDDGPGKAVTIMSIHKSKGLEFPVVFLCGLSRAFNRESARAAVLCDKELGIGLSCVDTRNRIRYPSIAKSAIATKMVKESLSEEMRVLYVAMTRAKDRLIMSYASAHLAAELTDLAMQLDICSPELLASEADCPGKWILMAALQRTESGALFELGGYTNAKKVSSYPWLVRIAQAGSDGCCEVPEYTEKKDLHPQIIARIKDSLAFCYPYISDTQTPSKQTATQLKGREKDQEAAEFALVSQHHNFTWREPSFSRNKIDGRAYGNAIHTVMQYIHYEACSNVAGVKSEVKRLVDQAYISQECGTLVDCNKILQFFTSDLGIKVRTAPEVLREFKFSILTDAGQSASSDDMDKVLLQGVVDCAVVEPDGITIIDFKTDFATEGSVPDILKKYRTQVCAYADALSRIYELPIKEKQIYLFSLGRFVEVI